MYADDNTVIYLNWSVLKVLNMCISLCLELSGGSSLPFLECLWKGLDFVTPHPMTVPVRNTKQTSTTIKSFVSKIHHMSTYSFNNKMNFKLLSKKRYMIFLESHF